MSLSELENMSFLTQEALKDTTIEFDLDNEGNQVAKISFNDAVTLFEKGCRKGIESSKKYVEIATEGYLVVEVLKENEKLKQENKKLKDCVQWYYENEIVSFDRYTEVSSCGQFTYATNLKARKTLKEIEESK